MSIELLEQCSFLIKKYKFSKNENQVMPSGFHFIPDLCKIES